ncbi:MAG: ABC transporter substrate-binding protein [Actinomycetes bacterium]
MKSLSLRSTAIALVTVASMAALTACGGGTATPSSSPTASDSVAPSSSAPARPITVLLDWFPNPDHVSLYLTKSNGLFEAAGLDVTLQPPSDPADPPKLVSVGQVALGISYQSEMPYSMQAGLKVKAVAALIPTALNSMIWLDTSGIKSLADLGGKTIGTAGLPTDTAFLSAVYKANNIDPASVNVVTVKTSLVQALESGKVDAVIGAYGNIEGVQLQQDGFKPTITPVSDAGVPNYDELVVIANSDKLASDTEYQQMVRDFLSALAKGTALAMADPAAAEAAMAGIVADTSGPALNAQIAATLPLLNNPAGFGQMDAAKWDEFSAFMKAQGLIDAVPAASDMLTNEFLS